MDGVIRRKLGRAQALAAEGGPGADRCFRLALARSARDQIRLMLDVTGLVLDRHSLTELLDMLPERGLIAMLEGPDDGLGLLCLSPDVLAGMVEAQTLGRVMAQPVLARKPTRTDAAMVAGVIDATMAGVEALLFDDPDLTWIAGFRYASFIEDARPLGLLLDDAPFRLLRADVVLAEGARAGQVLLALPAQGRGPSPVPRAAPVDEVPSGPHFTAALVEQLQAVDCVLDAVLTRMTVPLSAVMGLHVGDLVPLSMAALDRIGFEGLNGRKLAEGRLGQNRGMRAVRLNASLPGDSVYQGPQTTLLPTGTG